MTDLLKTPLISRKLTPLPIAQPPLGKVDEKSVPVGVHPRMRVSGHNDRLLAAVFGAPVRPRFFVETDFQPPVPGVGERPLRPFRPFPGVMELPFVFVVIDQALDAAVVAVAGKVRLVKG